MKRLVLLRHGETEWNSDDRVQGSVDVSLSEKGIRQARAVAAELERMDLGIRRLYSSDLKRASRTAAVIAERLGLSPAEETPLLRELDCGRWEGLVFHELTREVGEDFDRWKRDPGFRIPGGESLLDVRTRVEAFFKERREELEAPGTVAVVAHGLLNRMVLSVLMDLDPQACRFFAQGNAALNLFEWRGEKSWCTAWNAEGHLEAPGKHT